MLFLGRLDKMTFVLGLTVRHAQAAVPRFGFVAAFLG
jgi:hypothetical protein